MRTFKQYIAVCFLPLLLLSAQTEKQPATSSSTLHKNEMKNFSEPEFENPDKHYRVLAFWSWNEQLEAQELRKQIGYMENGGYGGFFMHARGGLITKYLSNDWFDAVKASVDEAGKRKMEAWMYDENTWPSGMGDQTISFKDIAYRETHLFVAIDSIPHGKNDVTVYSQKTITDPSGKKSEYYFYKWKAPLGNPRWKGGSYVDLLNPDVTKEFLNFCHEKYKSNVGNAFGTVIPGMFTDDINIVWDVKGLKKLALPWTDKMPEIFEKINGYSIVKNVDKLFLPLPGYEKVRVDFYRTVNKLSSENYWKMLYDWCESNQLKSTGHHMNDGLPFTDMMQEMQYQHLPGMDLLSNNLKHLLTLRAITSTANQLGRERTLCEAFAVSGHNLSFEAQKSLSNWLFVNGVNTITSHIFQYSMLGLRKRDCPPAMSYQQPWWEKNRYMSDYQARCSYLLTRGKRVSDILLLYPVESLGMVYAPNSMKSYDDLQANFMGSIDYLLENQLDFDLGSEEIISNYGSVEASLFKVGLADYKVLVLPVIRTIRRNTLELIHKFINQGGRVIATGQLPDFIDGMPINAEQQSMLKGIKMVPQEKLKAQLNKFTEPRIEVKSKEGKSLKTIRYSLREEKDKLLCFISNIDLNEAFSTEISIKGIGKLYQLELSTGKKSEVKYWNDNERTYTNQIIYPSGSVALLLDTTKPTLVAKNQLHQKAVKSTVFQLDSVWNMKLLKPNSITIDYCSYSVDGKNFSKPIYVLDMGEILKRNKEIKYIRYSFKSNYKYTDKAFLAIETPEMFEIKVNNNAVGSKNADFFIDKSFKKININGLIRSGENFIDLKLETLDGLSLESVYVGGNFGVNYAKNNSFELSKLKSKVNVKDLTKEGLPFFAGSVVLSKQIKLKDISLSDDYFIEFGELNATVAEVEINGQNAGTLCWKPYELNVKPFLKNGTNKIRITLTNSLHNMLGYHHSSNRSKFIWVSAPEFNNKKSWTNDYFIYPLGVTNVLIKKSTIR